MIKALLFDYGGVITDGGAGDDLSQRFAALLGLTPERAWELLMPVWEKFITGKFTEDEVWKALEKSYGKPIAVEQRKIWNSGPEMSPRPAMVQLLKRLHDNGYKLGLVSNVIPITAAAIRASGGYDGFDFLILSCEVGYSKPDREIYQLAMKKLPGIKPNEVIFVDDQERCLVPARALGMHTLLGSGADQIINDIEDLL